MNLLILVVLAALLGVIECGENANKNKFAVGHVTMPQRTDQPPCKKWGDVCKWGCKAQQTVDESFIVKRRRKCLNCECKEVGGKKYTVCINPHCDPMPRRCKKPSYMSNKCCGTCNDTDKNNGRGDNNGNGKGYGVNGSLGLASFTFPPYENLPSLGGANIITVVS